MEILATCATPELPLLVVGGQMKCQVSRGDEGFVTQVANVWVELDMALWLLTIRMSVSCQTGWTFR